MSRIHVECPDCKGFFDVKAMRAGHRVQCKLCGSVVRVPEKSESPLEAARDEAAAETRTVLKRRSFTDDGDPIYDDIFDDTSEVSARSRSMKLPRLPVSRQTLLLIGAGLIVLLAIYVAFQAGRSSAPVTMPPAPVVPIAPQP
ncbi:MAG: hypothetical protein SH850_23365 [Planctomycetaceae bacterium]|nr:hypothetical protein [Planctomycetaceae bacterium]